MSVALATDAEPAALYRISDSSGNLLYIGISTNVLTRIYQHQLDKPWWSEVAQITVEHFADREQAAMAEIAAIGSESPRYNSVASGRRGRRHSERQDVRWRRETEEHEQMLTTHWESHGRVACLNCGHRPDWIPKGELIVEVHCPNCDCPTLEREAAA